MKILYVITSTEQGGAEAALLSLAKETAKEHTVSVLCLRPLGKVATQLQQAGIPVKSLEMKGNFPYKTIAKIKQEIASFKPDIVHAMLLRAIEFTRVAIAGTHIPLVTTPHFDWSKKSFLLRLLDKALKPMDTLSVAESMSTAKYLVEQQKYAKDKVYFLPNSVDRQLFSPDKQKRELLREKYGFHVKTVFMSVARLAPEKDPLTLVKAFRNVNRQYPQTQLVLVGDGAEREKIELYVQESKMTESVFLAGEQHNVHEWLNMADVFVLPSLEESLPLALLEALSMGLPCIVSKVGDMPLWVEHGKNGYVFCPQDTTLLSCLMSELASNQLLRQKMSKFSAEKSSQMTVAPQKYQQIYQQIEQKFSRENNA